jgi:hypothetical protein
MNTPIPKKGCYVDIVDVNSGKIYFSGWKKPGQILGIPGTAIVTVYDSKADFEMKNDKTEKIISEE